MERLAPSLQPLSLPSSLSVLSALEGVLRLPSVASKRYLTNKVSPLPDVSFACCRHFTLCISDDTAVVWCVRTVLVVWLQPLKVKPLSQFQGQM